MVDFYLCQGNFYGELWRDALGSPHFERLIILLHIPFTRLK